MSLEDEILDNYEAEVARYRHTRNLAKQLYDRHEVEANYDLNTIKDMVDKYDSLDCNFEKNSDIIALHEVEFRMNGDYDTWYADVISKIGSQLKGTPTYNRLIEHLNNNISGYKKHLPESVRGDKYFLPIYFKEKKFDSRNTEGFYDTYVILPDEQGKSYSLKGFTKFFRKVEDYERSISASKLFKQVNLKYAEVYAGKKSVASKFKKKGPNKNALVTTSEFIEGVTLDKKMDELYQENNSKKVMETLKSLVGRLAETHVLGTDNYKELRGRYFKGRKVKKSLEMDYTKYFLKEHTQKEIILKNGGVIKDEDGKEIASVDTIGSLQTKASEDKLSAAIQKAENEAELSKFDLIKKYYLDPLERIFKKRQETGGGDFILGDPHLGNWIIKDNQEIFGIDLEMCVLGLAEHDLYKIIDDERGLKRYGIYEKGKKELIRHYLNSLNKQKNLEEVTEDELEKRIAIYDFFRTPNHLIQSTSYKRVALQQTDQKKKRDYEKWAEELSDKVEEELRQTKKYYSVSDFLNYKGIELPNSGKKKSIPEIDSLVGGPKTRQRTRRQSLYTLGAAALTALAIYAFSGGDEPQETLPPPKPPVVDVDPEPVKPKKVKKKTPVKTPEYLPLPGYPECLVNKDGSEVKIKSTGIPERDLRKKCGYSGPDSNKIVHKKEIENKDYKFKGKGRKKQLLYKGRHIKPDKIIHFKIPKPIRRNHKRYR